MTPRLLSRAEAAAYCGVTVSAFSDYVRRGLVPKALKGTQRWDRKAIDAALDRASGIADPSEKGKGGLTAADYLARYDQDEPAAH